MTKVGCQEIEKCCFCHPAMSPASYSGHSLHESTACGHRGSMTTIDGILSIPEDFRHALIAGRLLSARAYEKPFWHYESLKTFSCNWCMSEYLSSTCMPRIRSGWLPLTVHAVLQEFRQSNRDIQEWPDFCAARIAAGKENVSQSPGMSREKLHTAGSGTAASPGPAALSRMGSDGHASNSSGDHLFDSLHRSHPGIESFDLL